MKLSLVFPALNEEETITKVIGAFDDYCSRKYIDHEIVVVSDGSNDRTAQRVLAFAATHQSVRFVEHQKNLGYGTALRTGFSAATGEYVFYTDSDGQFLPDDLDATLQLLDSNTAVLGYRDHRTEGNLRRVNGWLWSRLVGLLLGFRIRDLDCAWKLFPRSLLSGTPLSSNGAFISAELMHRARRKGLKFYEIPVHHFPRAHGSSRSANLRVTLRAFVELVRFLAHDLFVSSSRIRTASRIA